MHITKISRVAAFYFFKNVFPCIYMHLHVIYSCILLSNFLHLLLSADKKLDGRSRIDRDADNQQLLQLEEKDVVSSVATVLSDLCGPGEWMPMEKLHSEVIFLVS